MTRIRWPRQQNVVTVVLALVVLLAGCAEGDEDAPVTSGERRAASGQPGAGMFAPPGSAAPGVGGSPGAGGFAASSAVAGAPGTPGGGAGMGMGMGMGAGMDKVDAVFLQLLVVYQAGGVDAARAFARMQGLLTANDEVRMTLVLDTSEPSVSEGTALAVGRLGGRVTATYGAQIELVVPVMTLVEYSRQANNRGNFFADVSGFRHVRDVRRTPTASGQQIGSKTPPPGASAAARSEGVEITGASVWHAAGITGRGVRVGVIDLGFMRYAEILGTQGITVRSFREDGKMEPTPGPDAMHGTACAEIVREMAPDAEIALAAAGDTPGGFIAAVKWLTQVAGVRVITTSIGFVGDFPTDGTSDLARAVDEARAAGVVFVKSAGNLGQGQYRAPFVDTDGDGLHDFPGVSGRNGLRVAAGGGPLRLWLNWDDWAQPRINYDLFVYDGAGVEVAKSTETQGRGGGKRPVESLVIPAAKGEYLVRVRKVNAGDADVPLTLIVGPGAALELTGADGTLTVPGDARGAVTVGAVDWRDGAVPRYSSRGPTLDGRPKPELGGPEGVWSAAHALVGAPSTFSGTSAAAPHVAGAAALVLSTDPAAAPDAVRDLLVARAAPLRGAGIGAGRLDLGAPPPPEARTMPVATANPPVVAVAAPARVVNRGESFVDDFASPNSGLTTPGYRGGTYRIAAEANALLSQFYPVEVATPDATYAVTARRVTGAGDAPMGLIVRARDRDNYLLFVATNDGTFNVFARVNGSLRALLNTWTPTDAIRRDGPNRLQVEATRTHFAFSVNGRVVTVLEITDIWPTGGFGFAGGGGIGAGGEVAFTGYRVTTP